MPTGNHNWVCFDCRVAVRQPATATRTPKCPRCAEDCYPLGYAVEIPKKSDTRGWRKLRTECRKRHLAWSDPEAVRRVRDTHGAERIAAYRKRAS